MLNRSDRKHLEFLLKQRPFKAATEQPVWVCCYYDEFLYTIRVLAYTCSDTKKQAIQKCLYRNYTWTELRQRGYFVKRGFITLKAILK